MQRPRKLQVGNEGEAKMAIDDCDDGAEWTPLTDHVEMEEQENERFVNQHNQKNARNSSRKHRPLSTDSSSASAASAASAATKKTLSSPRVLQVTLTIGDWLGVCFSWNELDGNKRCA